MIWLYRFITWLATPLLRLLLWWRLYTGKEDPARLRERLGITTFPRPEGALLWVHAASVGESTSILPLLNKISERYPDLNMLVTTVTVASAKLMGKKLPQRAFHHYAPIDQPQVIKRFLRHWKPDFALWVESELWPNMILQTHRTGCEMIIVNGRMSTKSFRNWLRVRAVAVKLLDCFSIIYPQSQQDAERFRQLGAQMVEYVGNIKFDAPPLPADPKIMGELVGMIGGRPIWLGASTHPGEEAILAEVHKVLKELHPELLTIIVPRHASRGNSIAALLREKGLQIALRSKQESITAETDIYIADTMGELGVFYRLAGIVFIGGSMVAHGGQNPLEAARLDCAVVYGPHMENFRAICHELEAANACITITTVTQLEETIDELLRNQEKQEQLAQAALKMLEDKGSVVEKLLESIAPKLDAINSKYTNITQSINSNDNGNQALS